MYIFMVCICISYVYYIFHLLHTYTYIRTLYQVCNIPGIIRVILYKILQSISIVNHPYYIMLLSSIGSSGTR